MAFRTTIFTLLFVVIILSGELFAGMYIKKQVGRDQTEELFLQDGRLKIVTTYIGMGPIQMSIVDTKNRRFILIQPARRLYMAVSFDEYRRFVENMQRHMPMATTNPEHIPFGGNDSAERRIYRGSGDTIAGYPTKVLLVERNGQTVERRLVSERFVKDLLKEIDLKALSSLGGAAGTLPAMSGAKTLRLMAEEMPLREEDLISRRATTVVKVEHRRLPEAEFAPPKGYREVSLEEFFFPGGNSPFRR